MRAALIAGAIATSACGAASAPRRTIAFEQVWAGFSGPTDDAQLVLAIGEAGWARARAGFVTEFHPLARQPLVVDFERDALVIANIGSSAGHDYLPAVVAIGVEGTQLAVAVELREVADPTSTDDVTGAVVIATVPRDAVAAATEVRYRIDDIEVILPLQRYH